jgi:glycosyltransferase involved in cell wall biosynthesis
MDLSPFLDSVPSGSLREKLSVPDGAKVIGAVARLFPLKGYEYFFPVAFRLAEKHPDIHFLIVGDGIMMESLKKEIARRSMEKRFSFAGLVAPSEIPDYIAIMDILVHLSLREGLPRAVVQAMASARPVVGFALDGTPEAVINGKTGFIVAPEDVDGVENALEELLSDPGKGRAMGEAGRKFVMEKWDWRKMAEILEKEYLEHVNN